MAAGDIKNAYVAKATLACTLTSLANGSARQSAEIDNTANLYRDALVRLKTTGAASGTGSVLIYAAAALGDGEYSDGASGSDAAFTAANRVNSVFLGAVQLRTTNAVVSQVFSVAAAFGGVMPSEVTFIILNSSGDALSATAADHELEVQYVYQTVAQ